MRLMRRRLLLAIAGFVLALPRVTAEDATIPPRHFTLAPAGEGVYAAIAKPGDKDAGGNAGFVVGTDSVLVVDTFESAAAAEELVFEIRKITPLPVRWVVNTHYHLDHVAGNGVFQKGGAVIVAHENVRAWLRTENLKWWKEISAEDRDKVEHLVLPDVVHKDGLGIWLGERQVQVLARPGHTGGDSIVVVPSANVVFAGDLFWKNTVPNLIDATTDSWVNTLDGFIQVYGTATYVPGHGELGKALDVRYFRDYLAGLRMSVARGLSAGKSDADLTNDVLAQQKARYGTWGWFDGFARRNIELTEQEIKGTKKLPRPPDSK